MSASDSQDDSWEDFFGSSPDLMPSIMGAFDSYIGNKIAENECADARPSTTKRSHQSGNFANLSPGVQKILSHVPEQEINKKFSSEETLGPKRSHRSIYRSMRSPEKSSDNVEIISSNVQKMLSNLPDTELVISASNLTISRNSSYLHSSRGDVRSKQFLYHSDSSSCNCSLVNDSSDAVCEDGEGEECKPLGSYLHSPKGVASRTPVGRKNINIKYLQLPGSYSPSSSATSSTTSATSTSTVATASESGATASRPVSLTSLGSCSSSGSSGTGGGHRDARQGSAYLASAESLMDSDPEPAGSQGSADSGIAEQEQPAMSSEQRVLQEVLDTETVYVADLREVIQGYLEPWRADPECPLASYLKDLFSNLEEIHKFNRSFLDDLCQAECDPTKIANVFVQNNAGFHVYNEYCTNYPRTMEILGKLQRDEKMAALFREKQDALHHPLPLGCYLLKPVQRILKYHLLLQRLSKQCESQHKPAVDLALTTMTAVASEINNMKRKHEDAVRVQEIQSLLYGWPGADLSTLGELIAEGTFRVQGARGRRHVFLFDKVLLLAKNKQDGALSYKTHITCSNLMLVEQVRGDPLSFQVLPFDNPRLQCTLRARSPQHKREWTLQIKRVILENYNAVIPNHARQLVMQLGQDFHETEDTTERWTPLKPNTSTPHYLERRSRIRKTRDFSNRRASSQDRSFVSLGSWRRKSDPDMIPQYNSKTMPKKISKLKKAKEIMSASTFYTDFSDSEAGDIAESTEYLTQAQEKERNESKNEEIERSDKAIEKNLEKIVSELLMQNQEFSKVLNRDQTRPRRNVNSEPGPMWYEERPKLPDKADSLPRSFQLNDQIEKSVDNCKNSSLILDRSLKENPEGNDEEQHENDLSSRLDDNEHPEHKIYRKSAMRLSLVQRIRMLMSEEQRNNQKFPLVKQGSRSMGEKIANPDYVDPHKLFHSRNSSSINLTHDDKTDDLMGERVELDLSLNEDEVLNELEKRLKGTKTKEEPDAGQHVKSSQSERQFSTISESSSQNSDSYYESILERSLTEEYVHDENGRLVAKQDSFNNNDRSTVVTQKRYFKTHTYIRSAIASPENEKKAVFKRPTKAPPPVPFKPSRLSSTFMQAKSSFTDAIASPVNSCNTSYLQSSENGNEKVQTSWVKAMVGRFE